MPSNVIEQEIFVHAPQHRVWSALTEGEHIGRWFGNGKPTRIDLRVDGMIVFDHGGHGDIPAKIETLTPMTVLTFRWAVIGPAGEQPSPTNSTVVSIRLEAQSDATKVRLTEEGFQSIDATPAEVEARYRANDRGWNRTLNELAGYVREMAAPPA
jgi:uncharacterized protein YndB with AHSA1/START domain